MRPQHHDEVKVAVYSANMPAPEEQSSQDLWLAAFMVLSTLTIVGLRSLA